jgi:hypothetical protein
VDEGAQPQLGAMGAFTSRRERGRQPAPGAWRLLLLSICQRW